jgi:hypothetical protein
MDRLIRAILDARGWKQADLAKRLGTTQSIVSRWLAGAEPRGNKRDAIRDLAEESGVVGERPPSEHHRVPVMGFIGAGASVDPDHEQVPPDGFYDVELPVAVDEGAIGFQVKGPSMMPVYDDGDVIVVHAEPRRSVESLIGDEAAIRTYDGKRFLKRLLPGSKRHLYTLVSHNAEPIIDVRIAWASEIIALVPAKQTRQVSDSKRARLPARIKAAGRSRRL